MNAIGQAGDADRQEIEQLLRENGLPLDGLELALPLAVVARGDAGIIGCAAVEPYGAVGLLRSVAVAPGSRGTGVGRQLVAAAERLAADRGIEDLYLLTETAEKWFPRLGYQPADRSSVPASLTVSPEFTTACPQTAVVLRRHL